MPNPIDNYNKIVTTVNSVTSDYTFDVDANNLIVIDTSNNRIGINTVHPQRSIHISGDKVDNNGLITPYIHLISGENLTEPTYGGNFRGSIIPDVSFVDGSGFYELSSGTYGISGGYSLGDASHPWHRIWCISADFTSVNIGANTLFMNGKPIIGTDEFGDINFGNNEQNIKIDVAKFNDISLQGNLEFLGRPGQSSKITSNTNIIIDPSGIGDNTGLVTIMGNLLVLGKQTTISSESLEISDNIITLNKGYNNNGPNNFTAGIEIENDTNNKPQLLWVNDVSSWKFIKSNNNELLNLSVNKIDVSGYIHNTNDVSYNVNISGNFVPTIDNKYSLGDNNKGWSDLYFNNLTNNDNSNNIYFNNKPFITKNNTTGNRNIIIKNNDITGDIQFATSVKFLVVPEFPPGQAPTTAVTANTDGGNIYNAIIGKSPTGTLGICGGFFSTLDADETSTFKQDLIVINDISVNQKLKVGSDVSLNANVDISNHLTVLNGDVSFNNNVKIGNHLTVFGDVSLNDNVDISNHLTVLGDVSLNANVDISGNLNILNKVHFKDSENITNFNIQDQNFVVDGSVGIKQKLIVDGDVSLNSNTTSSNSNTGALTVNGGVGIANDLNVGQNVTIDNNLTVEGNATFTSTISGNINGNAETVTNGIYTTSIPIDGQFLKWSSSGTAIWAADNNTTYSVRDGELTQINFTSTLKTKLDGIATGANNYSFPYTVSESNSVKTLVQRNSSGYIYANYFNTDPDVVSSNVSHICVETNNDGFIRHGNSSAVRTFLQLATTNDVTFKWIYGDRLYTKYQVQNTNNGYYSAFFTGSHGNINNFNFNVNINYNGLIVSCGDQYINIDYSMKPTISESLPLTKLTNIENDKAVFGVVAYQPDANYNINNFKVNSLGEGAIWITNKNGNLEIGDYITSSIITGYGQKQNDDLLHNYTVAKITCNCEFSLVKQIKQKIITISNENYIEAEYKEIGSSEERDLSQFIKYDDNGNIQYEDDLDLSGNQVYEYKFDTRFLDASSNILIDEEDYLTRLNNGENVYIACFVGCTYHCG